MLGGLITLLTVMLNIVPVAAAVLSITFNLLLDGDEQDVDAPEQVGLPGRITSGGNVMKNKSPLTMSIEGVIYTA